MVHLLSRDAIFYMLNDEIIINNKLIMPKDRKTKRLEKKEKNLEEKILKAHEKGKKKKVKNLDKKKFKVYKKKIASK